MIDRSSNHTRWAVGLVLVVALAPTVASCASTPTMPPGDVAAAARQWADQDSDTSQYPDRRVECRQPLDLEEGATTQCDVYSSINNGRKPLLGIAVRVAGLREDGRPALAFNSTINLADMIG